MTNLECLASGASLRDCVRFAKKLGVEVFNPSGAGDLVFRIRGLRPVRVHASRKDAGRAVTVFLRAAAARRAEMV